ncbi:MAG: amidohydrolase, partial [Acidobacteriota bacterium]|nr:amidohydrolase [Acidobacteriota bacterium]
MKRLFIFLLTVFTFGAVQSQAQTAADPALAAEIAKIKAIDNHAHPLKIVAAGEKADDEFDALPLDS